MNSVKSEKRNTVIYTAIFGRYDRLLEPICTPADTDFVCFTDQNFKSKVWSIRNVALPISDDPGRSNRYYKILPHRFFKEYEYSIYIDGNVCITGDITELITNYLKNADFAAFDRSLYSKLPARSVIDEVNLLTQPNAAARAKESIENIQKQMQVYKKEGFPDTLKTICGGVLVRKHNEPALISAMEAWWSEVLNRSKRDQVSFTYIAWREQLSYSLIPLDLTKNKYTKLCRHRTLLRKVIKKKFHLFFLRIVSRIKAIIQ